MTFHGDLQAKLTQGTQEDFGSLISEFAGQENTLFLVLFCGGSEMDFSLTLVRLLQVFSNVVANNDNSDAINPDSFYSQWYPDDHLSVTAAASLLGVAASFGIGLGVGLYQRRHRKYLQSFAYMAEQLKRVNPTVIDTAKQTFSSDEDKVALLSYVIKQLIKKHEDKNEFFEASKYQYLLSNPQAMLKNQEKILSEEGAQAAYEDALIMRKCIAILAARKTKQKHTTDYVKEISDFDANLTEENRAQYQPSLFVRLLTGKVGKLFKRHFGSEKGGKIKTVFNYIGKAFSQVWSKFINTAFIFWLTWMTFVIAAGFGAAIASPVLVPIIVGVSIGLSLGLIIWEVVEKIQAHRKGETPKSKAELAADKEAARHVHDAKLRLFMKVEREGLDADIKARITAQPKEQITKSDSKTKIDIRTRLLGSRTERNVRIFTSGIRGVIESIMFFSFVGWFLSTFLGLFTVLAGVAAVLGSNAVGGLTGLAFGSFLGFRAGAKMRAEQLAYEKKVDAILQAKYTGNDGAGATKQEAFENLFEALEAKKRLLLEKLSAQEIKDKLHYDLSHVDVFNDRYFEKFQYETPGTTIAKKIASHVYTFFAGSQTGTFHARFFFLKDAFFAGAIGAVAITSLALGPAMLPFLILAGVLAAAFGALKIVEYRLKRNQEHRENLYNTFDARISYLKKKNKELSALISLADAPKPTNPFIALGVSQALEASPESANQRRFDDYAQQHQLFHRRKLPRAESAPTPAAQSDAVPLRRVAATQ
jgi:hypothetical protein